jgi:integrase
MHCDGGGLYLQVTEGSGGVLRRSFLFRFATTKQEREGNEELGRERHMGLGSFPETGLSEARGKAAEARTLRKQRIDPIVARTAQRAAQAATAAKATTFDQCCVGYVADHEKGWGTDHKQVWVNSIRDYVSPLFGKFPVATVDTPLVLKVLKPMWLTKHETARRLRARIEAVLDWATAHHYREGPNPARLKGHLGQILDKRDNVHIVQHHRALPYTEIGKLVAELMPRNDRDALCLLLLIFTVVRVGAAVGARAEEFDLTKRIWLIPPIRMKRRGKRKAIPFRVPLSDSAIKIIERVGVNEGLLFPSAHDKSLAKAHGRADVTSHGFRATFKTWAEEQTSHANEIVEMALAHAVGDETEEAYRRGDALAKRATLLADWARYCTSVPAEQSNVTQLRQAG